MSSRRRRAYEPKTAVGPPKSILGVAGEDEMGDIPTGVEGLDADGVEGT